MLRGRRIDGAKFRRQATLGPYIADFYCAEAALVVEADGAHHFPPPPRDLARDAWLEAFGLLVLRLPNKEILEHPELVLDRIRRLLRARQTTPPLPQGEGVGG